MSRGDRVRRHCDHADRRGRTIARRRKRSCHAPRGAAEITRLAAAVVNGQIISWIGADRAPASGRLCSKPPPSACSPALARLTPGGVDFCNRRGAAALGSAAGRVLVLLRGDTDSAFDGRFCFEPIACKEPATRRGLHSLPPRALRVPSTDDCRGLWRTESRFTSEANVRRAHREQRQACAATSRTSTSSSVIASGTIAFACSLIAFAVSSDSKMIIVSPVLSFRVQYPVTNPGARETPGTSCSRRARSAGSRSLMVTLTTTACMLSSPVNWWYAGPHSKGRPVGSSYGDRRLGRCGCAGEPCC